MNVSYTPLDGTRGSLEPIGVSNEVFLLSENGGSLMDWEGSEYNPTRFKLTLEDGMVYIIAQRTGIESITYPYGHKISYSQSQIGHSSGDVLSIERVKDQLGRTIEYQYDENGNVLQETDALGNTVSFSYDDQGNRLTATDPLGNTTEYSYDDYGQVLAQSSGNS